GFTSRSNIRAWFSPTNTRFAPIPTTSKAMLSHRSNSRRTGGVYIAVLGSAMIIALLGMCAMIGQRIENRLISNSTDIRQAQLNASAAVELALLAMKQDTNW